MSKLLSIDYGALETIATPTLGNPTFGGIITKVLEIVFPIAGLATLFYLIYGGYLYLTSYGDPKGIQAATKTITNAIVGFLILSSSFIIMNILGFTLRLPSIQSMF